MVESTRQIQSRDPFDRFDEAVNDSRLYEAHHYGQANTLPQAWSDPYHDDPLTDEPVPLFLSNDTDAPKHRFGSGGERNISRAHVWSRILKGGIAAAFAAGIALAIMSMENPLSLFTNAKASLGGSTSALSGAAEPAQPPQRIAAQPANPEPPATPDPAATRRIPPPALASTSPSRDEITAAYQTALKGKVVAVEPVTREPPVVREPASRRIDPDELAVLLKRAKGLLAIGDITSARLLLERAADGQEAEAALMLAGTYDPQVLGAQDMRSVTPDPAAARLWYQKAAQLGSPDAKRRLGQTQN